MQDLAPDGCPAAYPSSSFFSYSSSSSLFGLVWSAIEAQKQRPIGGPADAEPGLARPAHVQVQLLLDEAGLDPVQCLAPFAGAGRRQQIVGCLHIRGEKGVLRQFPP